MKTKKHFNMPSLWQTPPKPQPNTDQCFPNTILSLQFQLTDTSRTTTLLISKYHPTTLNSFPLRKQCRILRIAQNYTKTVEFQKLIRISQMEKNFARRVEFIKYNSISQMVSNFISQIEVEMQTISRPSKKQVCL